MTYLKRLVISLAFTVIIPMAFAHAQTPQVSTVNVTPDEQRVRVSAVGDVLDMRVAVSNDSGDVVFESGPVTGEHMDWTMSSAEGVRFPPGAYTMTVTYRTSAGKLRRRVEQILVTDATTVDTGKQTASSPTPTAVGTITGEGTINKVAKFTGANTIGNSTITETGGRVGIGTPSPAQSIHVVGTASRLRLQSTGGTSLTTTEYVTNGRVWQSGAGGSTVTSGVANKFFIFDQTAGQFRLVVDPVGNFGIGTVTPTAKLTVNGGIQILGTGNGIKFPDGSIQTKATAGTITGTGATNRLAKFTGPNSFGNSTITENGGNVGIGTTAPQRPLEIANGRMRFSSNLGDIEFTETADLIAYATTASPDPSLSAFRLDVGTGSARVFTVLNNGKVGIGTPAPASMLEIKGDGSTFLLRVFDSQGQDAFKVVNNGVVSFGALYSLSSTNHLCYHAPANLALTTCSSAAEYVPTVDNGSGFPETAELVSIAPTRANPYGDKHAPFVVQKSATACDDQLLGYIVNPESGADGGKLNDHYLPLAIYGYFPAKVTTENGAIKRGDPITSSSKAGYGMKATGACKIIGYALEDADREGRIQVFANLGESSSTQVKNLRAQFEQLQRGRDAEVETLKSENAAIKARLEMLERGSTAKK